MNMFEQATKEKYRYTSVQGQLSTEDLWDSKLGTLDTIAQSLSKLVKDANDSDGSFIHKNAKTAETKRNERGLEVVIHIIEYKLAEQERAAELVELKNSRTRLAEIIADKENEKVKSKSLPNLKERMAKLDAKIHNI